MKPKKCKVCKNPFNPLRALQMVCSASCGYAYSNKLKSEKITKDKKI